MFRFQLVLVIAVSFCFVLFLGIVLYWGSSMVAQNYQRTQSAYEAFDHYERLSQEAYSHFKHRMDRLASANPAADAGVEASKQRLYQAMETLRNAAVAAPPVHGSRDEWQSQRIELERVARFTAFLEASEYRFDEVERLRLNGKQALALQALVKFSKAEIDEKFLPLINAAINGEREKARAAQEELKILVSQFHSVAIFAAAAAALFSLGAGILLIRGISKPIEALMLGTDEIASGNLAYRIDLDSHDEFSYLAKHFNQMADELEVQQKNVSIGRAVLEKRVEERTIELHRLNGELQKMDTKRREFLADIGHELRTPITVIRGEAEVALRRRDRDEAAYQLDRGEQATAEETIRQRERDAEDYQDVLQRIVEMSIQLGKYVNDLLFLASAETASLQFEWDRVDLAELVTSAVEDFQVMAQENSITVWLDAPPTPVWVRGDKQRLRQVLFILGDNACRYSKPGGHITAILMADRKEAVFSLSDQGIGIPVQDLLRIFDRHFRSKNARRSRDDGSGLGLPMAKSILKAHGGKISVASIENAGSTFTVSLPLISPEQTGL